MQKKFCVNADGYIKRAIAFIIITAMLLCAIPYAPFVTEAAYGDNNDGTDFSAVFKKGNGIYLGTYNHATKLSSLTDGVVEREYDQTPILWEVNEILDDDGGRVMLTSKYVLDFMEADDILAYNIIDSGESNFLSHERDLIESVQLLDINYLKDYYSSSAARKAYLKNGSSSVNWLAENIAEGGESYVTDEGSIVESIDDISDGNYYGFRPSIIINTDNIIYAGAVAETANGYIANTNYYKLTILEGYYSENLENLELINLQTASEDTIYIGDILEVNLNGTLNLTASSNKDLVSDRCEINYKITDSTIFSDGKTVKYGTAQGSPVKDMPNPLAIRSAGLRTGGYTVYLWLQQNNSINSNTASTPLYFTMEVTAEGNYNPAPSDVTATGENAFGIVVDYYNEVIRLISAEDLRGREYAEAATYEDAATYKEQAEDYYANSGDKVVFMYCLKATPDSSIKEDKKIKTYLAEKWYPVYGNTIDISKVLPKTSKSKTPYCVAIRRADDIFFTDIGYSTRRVVPLKPRNSDSQFKKQISYDSENQMFTLSSGDDINVLYRMNYFITPIPATMSASRDSTKNIKVPANVFPIGGVLYISTMPVVSNGEVVYAASKPVKISVPKRLSEPAVKVEASSGRIKSLKKDTTEFSYDGLSWATYTGTTTAIDIKDVKFSFPEIKAIDDDNYVLYFRTKATEKNPASEAKTLLIPRSLADTE